MSNEGPRFPSDIWKDLVNLARTRLSNPERPGNEAEALDAARWAVTHSRREPQTQIGAGGRAREQMVREIARRLLHASDR